MQIAKELKQKMILLVDDDTSIRNIIKVILHKAGFTDISGASNGKDAQIILKKIK